MSLQRRLHRRYAVRVRHRLWLCVCSTALRVSKQRTTAIPLHAHLIWMRLQRCHHRRHTARVHHCLCIRSAAMRDAEQRSAQRLAAVRLPHSDAPTRMRPCACSAATTTLNGRYTG